MNNTLFSSPEQPNTAQENAVASNASPLDPVFVEAPSLPLPNPEPEPTDDGNVGEEDPYAALRPLLGGEINDRVDKLRPGIENATLRANGISLTDPGVGASWGMEIPYFTFEGGENGRFPMLDNTGSIFTRERVAKPGNGPKYLQKANTSPMAYFPRGLLAEMEAHPGVIIITEGEFKAIALVEAGYPAVALGGFSNFVRDGRLLDELVELFDDMSRLSCLERTIYFLGDADTALNPNFSSAAVGFRDALQNAGLEIPVLLPRMPVKDFKTRKGIDDVKDQLSPCEFTNYISELIASALPVHTNIEAPDLMMRLINRERSDITEILSSATADDKPAFAKAVAKMANFASPLNQEELISMAVETGLVAKTSTIKKLMKEIAQKTAREMERKRTRLPAPVFYCPNARKTYLYGGFGCVTNVDRIGVTNYLVEMGYSRRAESPGDLSEVEQEITRAEQSPIDWAGALGGKSAGLIADNGMRLLVTKSPFLLTPAEGSWNTIREFLESRLNYDPDLDFNEKPQAKLTKTQSRYLLGYLSVAAKSLYFENGRFVQSQALVLSGGKGVGKNRIQENLITPLMGGRMADPFDPMSGASNFNEELAGAEHWMIADKQTSAKYADRAKIKSCIKEACVNRMFRLNAKHRTPINVESWRRLSISLNDTPECLRVLPDLSSDFADKLMILHVVGDAFHGEGTKFPTFADWEKQVESELPAFLYYLLHEHEIQPCESDLRYGITSYQDPEILERLFDESPAGLVLRLLDRHLPPNRSEAYEKTAKELFDILRSECADRDLETVGCRSEDKLGKHLSALEESHPDRVIARPLNGRKLYRFPRIDRIDLDQPEACSAVETLQPEER